MSDSEVLKRLLRKVLCSGPTGLLDLESFLVQEGRPNSVVVELGVILAVFWQCFLGGTKGSVCIST